MMPYDRECWENLANAIILQALEDYSAACLRLKKCPCRREWTERKRSIEHFFSSRWFRCLSGADPRLLLETARKENVRYDK